MTREQGQHVAEAIGEVDAGIAGTGLSGEIPLADDIVVGDLFSLRHQDGGGAECRDGKGDDEDANRSEHQNPPAWEVRWSWVGAEVVTKDQTMSMESMARGCGTI